MDRKVNQLSSSKDTSMPAKKGILKPCCPTAAPQKQARQSTEHVNI